MQDFQSHLHSVNWHSIWLPTNICCLSDELLYKQQHIWNGKKH